MERRFHKLFHRSFTMQPYHHDEKVAEMECFNPSKSLANKSFGSLLLIPSLDDALCFLRQSAIPPEKLLHDPDLCRNATEYTNNHRNKYAAEITLHFIN